MATQSAQVLQTQPIQQPAPTQTAETQTAQKDETCTFKITDWMRECAAERGMPTVRLWLLELALAERAERRAKKFRSEVPCEGERAKRIEIDGNDHDHTKLRPEDIQRLIFLSEQKEGGEKLTTEALARRMRVSKSTIRRILRQRERLVRPASRPNHGQTWGSLGKWRQP